MKFPLPKNLFPPLELSSAQEQDYEQLAKTLVKATLGEYDRFVLRDHKRVDARRWKLIRTRDGVSMYQECDTDGGDGCQQTSTSLALYQSTVSCGSSRPSHNMAHDRLGPVTSTVSTVLSHDLLSATSVCSGGPLSSPRTAKSVAGMHVHDASLDGTTRPDSYGSIGGGAGDRSFEPHVTTAAFSGTKSDSSGLPRLLAVGTLRGSLDDVMYGVVSPSASSVRLRSSYLDEHIADCAVLREIRGPSVADPFSFLGIKWLVRAKHRSASRIVFPRDFVVLEFSGIMMRPDDSRVGFYLIHSVQIPTCRELQEHRIVRAKVSSCYIFEETSNNCVQMFMTASVDPSGHVLDRMAVRSAATALSNCWKSVSCAQDKKLAFCLQNERPSAAHITLSSRGNAALGSVFARSSRSGTSALRPVNESSVHETMESFSQRSDYSSTTRCRRCGVCRGKLGKLSKTLSCQLCCEQICSRCRIVRKLSSSTLNAQVTQSSINFCKKCVASVGGESALEIARQELWVRTRGRSCLQSEPSTTHSRRSLSQEKSTYETVVLGRGSLPNSGSSESIGRGNGATRCHSYGRGRDGSSRGRNLQPEDLSREYSVGSRLSASAQSSTPLQVPSSLTKNMMRGTLSMSTDRLSSAASTSDSLSLTDLGMGNNSRAALDAAGVVVGEVEVTGDEPVVLDHRMTMTIRSLRHLDYVLSVGEQDLVNELESEGTEEYGEFESGDEFEGRSSYESSVAVLDDANEACETPRSDFAQSQREVPIVEEGENDKRKREADSGPEPTVDDDDLQVDGTHAERDLGAEEPKLSEENEAAERCLPDGEEADKRTVEPTEEAIEVAEPQMADEDDTSAPAIRSERPDDSCQESDEDAMSLTQLEPRVHRANTIVASEETTTYQHQLFQQMQDLHHVVESTYQVARANTEAAFKERDSGRAPKSSPSHAADTLRGVRTFSQPFAFNVVGLRSTRAMTVGRGK
ncbi:unnamed protein product [Hyaloperonospora brassicae]|uniref:FYVE-type domain-containing protein n=1 Tax=Hyaloperonospora brassicae TaxID=162125 RepID=A0AAV0UF81_HYABA|nr:unnamed protein product [Hyaloperonospora brassicae]